MTAITRYGSGSLNSKFLGNRCGNRKGFITRANEISKSVFQQRRCFIMAITTRVQLRKKVSGHQSQEA
jgi:hypothetical protein